MPLPQAVERTLHIARTEYTALFDTDAKILIREQKLFMFIQREAETTLELYHRPTYWQRCLACTAMQVVDVFESFDRIQTVCV